MKNYKRTCRICLTYSSPRDLVSLFEGNYTDYIHELTGIKINTKVAGKIPTNVCVRCSEALIIANQIRKQCLSSEKYLRRLAGEDCPADEMKPDKILAYNFSSSLLPVDVQPIVKIEMIKEEIASSEGESREDFSTGFDVKGHLVYDESDEPSTVKDSQAPPLKNDVQPRQRRQQENPADNMMQCQKCGKLYHSRYLKKHINSHDKPVMPPTMFKIYRCDICDYVCKLKAYMTSHMNAQHVVNKKYQCEFCSRSFTKLFKLRDHVFTHTGEKTYLCPVPDCGKKFHAPKNLKCHIRVHNNDARYGCKFCDRKFIQFIDHKRHELSHSGKKLYNCSYANCERGFNKKTDLKRHIETHHLTL